MIKPTHLLSLLLSLMLSGYLLAETKKSLTEKLLGTWQTVEQLPAQQVTITAEFAEANTLIVTVKGLKVEGRWELSEKNNGLILLLRNRGQQEEAEVEIRKIEKDTLILYDVRREKEQTFTRVKKTTSRR